MGHLYSPYALIRDKTEQKKWSRPSNSGLHLSHNPILRPVAWKLNYSHFESSFGVPRNVLDTYYINENILIGKFWSGHPPRILLVVAALQISKSWPLSPWGQYPVWNLFKNRKIDTPRTENSIPKRMRPTAASWLNSLKSYGLINKIICTFIFWPL